MTLSMNIGLDSENTVNFVCSVGDKLKICQPASYPPTFTSLEAEDEKYYLKGFIILDQDIGEFEGSIDDCVYYRHKRSGRQIIQYSSQALGEKNFYLVLDGVIVHDHASVPQGGPAYATYYARTPTEEGGA